jgi:hypothetical protein
VTHVSADEHALSNERKRKELQDLQGGPITERCREEWKAMNLKAAQGKKDKEPDEEPSVARPPRNRLSGRVAQHVYSAKESDGYAVLCAILGRVARVGRKEQPQQVQ